MLVIPALVRLRHEGDCKLKAIMVYIERSCLKKPEEEEEGKGRRRRWRR